MKKPKAMIFSGYGLNCEGETKYAFELAGAGADIVHINDLVDGRKKLSSYQILAFPGGFAYGDDTGAGNAYAGKLKNHLWEEIVSFVPGNHLIIGICNGCQILVNLGLFPVSSKQYEEREAALLQNDSGRYTVRWTDVKSESSSPWLAGIDTMMLPIAHGEGKFYATDRVLATMREKKMIALRYIHGEICAYQGLPANPTGTLDDIAAITDQTGKILGIMPHPERAIFFTQLPHWPYLKEQYVRRNMPLPKEGPGLKIFQNAVAYFA
ncbi:phosphoribosylformylglycinamidine synthase subunit PurQ [Candidatus Gottesmanbacteria bacterium]|nr:phosphoribosylformylglycinamidine synthase subunit PurQ [Candidatus Gottesmanbacteria bacterium]